MDPINVWKELKQKKQSIDIELAKLEERKSMIKKQIQDKENELKSMGIDYADLDTKIKSLENDLEHDLNQYSQELERVTKEIQAIKQKVS